jgi:hypothetical protein
MADAPKTSPGQPDPERLKIDMEILLTALNDPNLYDEFGNIDTPPEHPAVKPNDPPPPTMPPRK